MTLTVRTTSRILHRTMTLVSIPRAAPHASTRRRGEHAGTPRGMAGEAGETEEAAVSDEERTRPLIGEAEAYQRAFEGLPAAGTPAYWKQIADTQHPLPLEVLARCGRERYRSGYHADAQRVATVIYASIQHEVREFAQRVVRPSWDAKHQDVASDLAQEIHLKVWEELTGEKESFLLTQFKPALIWIEKHAAHKVMEQLGEWSRRDVERGKHVPVAETVRINRPRTDDEGRQTEMPLADQRDEETYEQVETKVLLEDLLGSLNDDQRRLIYSAYYQDQTQEQIAAQLGITDRTVRNRLKTLLDELRGRARDDGEEDSSGIR